MASETNGKPASKLGGLKRERKTQAHRLLFYGTEGLGKSTLASCAPDPIFFDIEDGTGDLEVARYPFHDGADKNIPRDMEQINGALRDLYDSDHDYKTLVIDTIDRLESMIWKAMLARDSGQRSIHNKNGKPMNSIEDYGYGKGYNMAVDEWRSLAQKLDLLRLKRGMVIILLGHANVRPFKNPEGEDYDRYTLRIHEKAGGFLKEWCDVAGFCQFEELATKKDESDRIMGISTGRRLVRVQRTAAYDAKTRLPLPDPIELETANPWAPFGNAMAASDLATPKGVAKLITIELNRIKDKGLASKVLGAVTSAKDDLGTLNRYLNDLRKRTPKEETSQ